jgi:aryl-alcohol dehydrogenase-like predicted oxidoreductase
MIRVRYRINQKTQDKISEIGLGSAYMPQTPLKEAIPALRKAYEGGINYYDLAAVTEKPFPCMERSSKMCA